MSAVGRIGGDWHTGWVVRQEVAGRALMHYAAGQCLADRCHLMCTNVTQTHLNRTLYLRMGVAACAIGHGGRHWSSAPLCVGGLGGGGGGFCELLSVGALASFPLKAALLGHYRSYDQCSCLSRDLARF